MVVARIRALAPDHTDRQIAALLDQEGFRSGTGGSFTANKVAMDSIYTLDHKWLSRGAGRMSRGLSGGWTMFGPGSGGAAQCECLHDRRLVPIGPSGWHPGGPTAPGGSSSRRRSSPSCANPSGAVVPAFRDLTDQEPNGGQALAPKSPTPL